MRHLLIIATAAGLNLIWAGARSVPVRLLGTVPGIGQHYFSFLPDAWRTIPLLHVEGSFALVLVIRNAMSRVSEEART